MYLSILGLFTHIKFKNNLFTVLFFYFVFQSYLNCSHLIIPNRAFEINDLFCNNIGVVSAFFVFNLFKKFKN